MNTKINDHLLEILDRCNESGTHCVAIRFGPEPLLMFGGNRIPAEHCAGYIELRDSDFSDQRQHFILHIRMLRFLIYVTSFDFSTLQNAISHLLSQAMRSAMTRKVEIKFSLHSQRDNRTAAFNLQTIFHDKYQPVQLPLEHEWQSAVAQRLNLVSQESDHMRAPMKPLPPRMY